MIEHVERNPQDLQPVIQEFKALIEGDSRIYMLASSMFGQIPSKHPYMHNPTGGSQVRDYQHMLRLLNHLLTSAPSWSEKSHGVGLVGLPIYALFDWSMGTSSGFSFYLDPQVNAMLKKVLNVWGEFLQSPASAACLNDGSSGWFGPTSRRDLASTANIGETSFAFGDLFVCDSSAKHHGFKSWDDFFTRVFRDGKRPVASPDDHNVIANACESLPYATRRNVKHRDQFWIKGQPYSLIDMLAGDDRAKQFVGGTVYQAFLSALSYHRWHSPVRGRIVKAFVKDGTYYSEPLWEDFGTDKGANYEGENSSQGYISAVATRAIVFIEAENPGIGLMAVIAVGMVEVSSCDITVKEGQQVDKGEQIGMFHFGGSTHCVLFRKDVNVQGLPEPGRKQNVPVCSRLAALQ